VGDRHAVGGTGAVDDVEAVPHGEFGRQRRDHDLIRMERVDGLGKGPQRSLITQRTVGVEVLRTQRGHGVVQPRLGGLHQIQRTMRGSHPGLDRTGRHDHEVGGGTVHPDAAKFVEKLLGVGGSRWPSRARGEASPLGRPPLLLGADRDRGGDDTQSGHAPTGLIWSTPKSHECRSVPFPAFLAEELATLMVGKRREELVFTAPAGGVLRVSTWRPRVFNPAVKRLAAKAKAFPTVAPHDLRHTAASLAISAGANVKAVQTMLGHASAELTLDT